jgi:hypothetical protein
MMHSGNPEIVKKRQVLRFQTFANRLRIAQMRPWDFNFRITQPQSVKTEILSAFFTPRPPAFRPTSAHEKGRSPTDGRLTEHKKSRVPARGHLPHHIIANIKMKGSYFLMNFLPFMITMPL